MAFIGIDLPSNTTPTLKLYHTDAYLRAAAGTVLWMHDEYVVLDQTPFYAQAGGQEPDFGIIGEHKVVDVQHHAGRFLDPLPGLPDVPVDTVIVHRLEEPPKFTLGESVKSEIDWDRRYAIMRSHSACHFVFQAVAEIFGKGIPLELAGCRIHPDGSRMDFRADLDPSVVREVEGCANAMISRSKDISLSPAPNAPGLYLWNYGDEFTLPCGGTHVRSARELNPLKLKREKQGRGLTRISTKWGT